MYTYYIKYTAVSVNVDNDPDTHARTIKLITICIIDCNTGTILKKKLGYYYFLQTYCNSYPFFARYLYLIIYLYDVITYKVIFTDILPRIVCELRSVQFLSQFCIPIVCNYTTTTMTHCIVVFI